MKKLKLDSIKVRSFVTELNASTSATVKAGDDPKGNTAAFSNCDDCTISYSAFGVICTGDNTTMAGQTKDEKDSNCRQKSAGTFSG